MKILSIVTLSNVKGHNNIRIEMTRFAQHDKKIIQKLLIILPDEGELHL